VIKKRINELGKKTGAQNIVKETKQYQKNWPQHVQRMDTNRIPKQAQQYNCIEQKDEGTLDDRRRDGGTNFILRIKEQETRLTLHERDDDDDEVSLDNLKTLKGRHFVPYLILLLASSVA